MPQHPLRTIKALAVLGSLCTACMPELVHDVQGLAVGVEQLGRSIGKRVSRTGGIPGQACTAR